MRNGSLDEFSSELRVGHQEDAVEIPFDPAKQWGVSPVRIRNGRNGHDVNAELNGIAFQSVIVARSRKFWLIVPVEIREAAAVKTGDIVTIGVEPRAAMK